MRGERRRKSLATDFQGGKREEKPYMDA